MEIAFCSQRSNSHLLYCLCLKEFEGSLISIIPTRTDPCPAVQSRAENIAERQDSEGEKERAETITMEGDRMKERGKRGDIVPKIGGKVEEK